MASPDAVALAIEILEAGRCRPDCDASLGSCKARMRGTIDRALAALKAEPPPHPDLELARRVRDGCAKACDRHAKSDNRTLVQRIASERAEYCASDVRALDLESIVRGGK